MISDKIFGSSPYEGFDITPFQSKVYLDPHEAFTACIHHVKPSVIVEVGTWQGGSAIYMAKICKALNLSTEIVCVDTWLGAAVHWQRGTDDDHWGRQNLRLINGYPSIYYQFMANVLFAECSDIITPLPISSNSGAKLLKNLGVVADLVYIDAGHDYRDVKNDIEVYWSLLRVGGIMIGDDYQYGCPGVIQASEEFARSIGQTLQISSPKWILSKLKA